MLCMLGAAMGAVLLALGGLLLAQKPPQSTCMSAVERATVGREVAIEVLEASTVDAVLLALGIPMVASGAILVWWSLRGNIVALRLKRNPTAQLEPVAKLALVVYFFAALFLWISLFVSFYAAPVLKELCTNFQCDPVWAVGRAIAAEGLQCWGVQTDMRNICDDQEICCGCQMSWDGGDTPHLVCKEMVGWACQCATLEIVSSHINLLFAILLSVTTLLFYLIVKRRCRNCISEADDDEDMSKLSDVQRPRMEDEPSPMVSPSLSEQGAIADGPLALADEVAEASPEDPHPPVVWTHGFGV